MFYLPEGKLTTSFTCSIFFTGAGQLNISWYQVLPMMFEKHDVTIDSCHLQYICGVAMDTKQSRDQYHRSFTLEPGKCSTFTQNPSGGKHEYLTSKFIE